MADLPQGKPSKGLIEARLASKLPVMAHLPPGLQERSLESYANQAYPDGSEKERDEFKRYWRERLDREQERWERERDRRDRPGTLPRGGYSIEGIEKEVMDESKFSEFKSRQAQLRLEGHQKEQLTELKAINAYLGGLVVDAATDQAFRETFGRTIRPADYLALAARGNSQISSQKHVTSEMF